MSKNIPAMTISELLQAFPWSEDFFSAHGLRATPREISLSEYIEHLEDDFLEDIGTDRTALMQRLLDFIATFQEVRRESAFRIQSISIRGGRDKKGALELAEVTCRAGEVIGIVGPTGSGKSRLLEDIECMSQGDTPTGRRILLNGREPDEDTRLAPERKLVAQLSQNMNFIMDLSVAEFIRMHAESRMTATPDESVQLIFETANDLAGESFELSTPVTGLSGGQSRALMIADTACLSASPIILIDEIENAGIDRKKALDLLVRKEKIVLVATHDPVLALMADKRIIIRNGGMARLIHTTSNERKNLAVLNHYDAKITALRQALRSGERLDFDMEAYFETSSYADDGSLHD